MPKKIVIVPEDSTVLIDGAHLTHPNMDALAICAKTESIRPRICVRAAHYDEDEAMAMIEWTVPKHSWITKEKFLELFGDAVEDHALTFAQLEAEQMNHVLDDEEQTRRIAEHENKLLDERKKRS